MKEFWRSQKCDKFTTYEPTVEQNTSSTAEEQYMLYIQITENTLLTQLDLLFGNQWVTIPQIINLFNLCQGSLCYKFRRICKLELMLLQQVTNLDKERPQAIPLVRPLPIPHLLDWRKMEVCLINFNKGEDDEGCLQFCNILKWGATV